MGLVSVVSLEDNILEAKFIFLSLGEGSGTATFSGRREGLALYFARLVRSIWKAKIVKTGYMVSHSSFIITF